MTAMTPVGPTLTTTGVWSGRARRSLGLPRRLRRAQIVLGATVVAIWLVVMLTVQWWAPYDPFAASGPRLQAPSGSHWLGTDALGRDVLTRVLYGARQSLPTAGAVIASAVLIGGVAGTLAGYGGRWADAVVMRIADVTLAFPPILLAMAVAAALGPGLRNGLIAMVVVWWPIYARLVRAQVLSVKNREHVDAAVVVGATRWRILRRHVLPLSLTPVLVNATMDFGQVVILTASLSFLGLGALPPSPEWGSEITEGAKYFYQWWVAVAPGAAMLTVVLATNFMGDGLRDLLDPRSRR
ncbi:MAG TPA: ABC transporter permease [Mycobacteriales bacterium]|jgi:peptide/nickel transport system permease protein|nr:ABC transporter permease [Mycobacteriales bacterium]